TEGRQGEGAAAPGPDETGDRPVGDAPPDNGNAELHAEVESVEAHVEALHDAVHEVLHGGTAESLDERAIEQEVDELLEAAAEDASSEEDPPALATDDAPPTETGLLESPVGAVASGGEGTGAAESAAFAPSGGLSEPGRGSSGAAETALAAPSGSEGSAPAQGSSIASAETGAPARPPRQQGQRSARREVQERRGRERDRGRGQQGRERREETPRPRRDARIEDLLKVGQEVVVQISKDPIGSKGARLTSHISIPGRHLVFMPTVDHVGISRRISNEKERRRLREIVDRLRPPGTGFIVRTVAQNVPQAKLESDIRFLIEIWSQVVRKNEKRGGPGLMHPDLDLILRATRDLFAADVEKLVVDEREEYERILGFVTAQDPALAQRVV